MTFKAKVHECSIEDDGETFTFYVREPSGREILEQAQKANARKAAKQPDPSPVENAQESFKRFVVHQDGTPLKDGEVEEMLDFRFSAMQRITDEVLEKTGLGRAAVEAAKKA
jgi:hypothetical protein